MSVPAIATYGLTRRFGRHWALRGLNLQVEAGSIFGFIGPNGAGKTTTLRILAGLLDPSAGTVQLLGQPLEQQRAQQLIGYMPDFFGLYDDLRVWEYLDFFARCYGLNAAQRRSTVEQLLELVDLSERRTSFVQTLSRGMQQRLCLAHALVHNPPILLLDEPASGLDPRARVELRELLRTLRDMGKTIMLSSHILPELGEICTHVGVIEAGEMRLSMPMTELRRQQRASQRLIIHVAEAPARALELLQRLDPVQHVQADPGDPHELRVELGGAEGERVVLLRKLLEAGIAVSEYRSQEIDLEDLFLRLTEAAR